tara:strand:- start:879 stop:2195 length:1317 start_codon:yes stop_codon:yes gene_type:complete
MTEKILLIGSGAREHAIAKALNKSKAKIELFCMASSFNPGIAEICSEIIVEDFNDIDNVIRYSKEKSISLSIIGPESPLETGLADSFWNEKIKVVGPKKDLAKIETSKSFARDLLRKHKIPGCPKYKTFNSLFGVESFLKEIGDHFVIKFDGLAGGKGVKVSGEHLSNHADALDYCKQIIDAKGLFVVEEKFLGEEFSLMSFCDGNTLQHMPAIQDHKRAYEGDTGPNTGGMGTYTDHNHSLPFLKTSDIQLAQNINILVSEALKKECGEGYKGILYGGFMATSEGIKVIEYNARFGDPEAMNVLSILETDFFEICDAISSGLLNKLNITFQKKATVCKYAVPEGYPDSPVKGKPIYINSDAENLGEFFHASVDLKNNKLIQLGSRTIAAVGVADTISEAEKIAEKKINCVKGPLFHRSDIGTSKIIQKRIKHMDQIR